MTESEIQLSVLRSVQPDLSHVGVISSPVSCVLLAIDRLSNDIVSSDDRSLPTLASSSNSQPTRRAYGVIFGYGEGTSGHV